MNSIIFILILSIFISSSLQSFLQYTNYCCIYEDDSKNPTKSSCSLGGCPFETKSTLKTFYPVVDCQSCDAQSFPNTTSTTGLTTECLYCDDRSVCSESISYSGCKDDYKDKDLFAFSSTLKDSSKPLAYIAETEFCCWWTDPANNFTDFIVASAIGGCPHNAGFGIHNTPLATFVQHGFDYDCPKDPPCIDSCNNHGICAVNQCACDHGYSGDDCDVYCDPKTCLHGTCVRTLQEEREAMFDNPFTTHDEIDAMIANSKTECKCSGYWDGEHCDHCLPQYIGPNCQQFCASAPCNATHMTGSCTDNKCDCEQGFDGPLCDTCAKGFAGPNCTCDNTACGAPGYGKCNNNGTCDCFTPWVGDHCDKCGCLPNGNCTTASNKCECKERYGGQYCDECQPPYYNIDQDCS